MTRGIAKLFKSMSSPLLFTIGSMSLDVSPGSNDAKIFNGSYHLAHNIFIHCFSLRIFACVLNRQGL